MSPRIIKSLTRGANNSTKMTNKGGGFKTITLLGHKLKNHRVGQASTGGVLLVLLAYMIEKKKEGPSGKVREKITGALRKESFST